MYAVIGSVKIILLEINSRFRLIITLLLRDEADPETGIKTTLRKPGDVDS